MLWKVVTGEDDGTGSALGLEAGKVHRSCPAFAVPLFTRLERLGHLAAFVPSKSLRCCLASRSGRWALRALVSWHCGFACTPSTPHRLDLARSGQEAVVRIFPLRTAVTLAALNFLESK